MDGIAKLVEDGEEIVVIDNTTGEDITTIILSQLISRNLSNNIQNASSEMLTTLLRKGSGGLFNFARKPVGLLQRAASLTGGSIDKFEDFITILHGDPDQDDLENQDDQEAEDQSSELKQWLNETIDGRIEQALKKNNLATKKQISTLRAEIKKLTKKIEMTQE